MLHCNRCRQDLPEENFEPGAKWCKKCQAAHREYQYTWKRLTGVIKKNAHERFAIYDKCSGKYIQKRSDELELTDDPSKMRSYSSKNRAEASIYQLTYDPNMDLIVVDFPD